MDVVICGAGDVGRHVAEVLGGSVTGSSKSDKALHHNITVIDRDPRRLSQLEEVMDLRTLSGNGIQADIQTQAGVPRAGLFIAATHSDETNLLAASVATALGCEQTIARVHHSPFFERRGLDYAQHLGIDHLVCPEHASAQTIAAALRSPGALAFERFAGDKIEMHRLVVADGADVAGKKLAELKLNAAARVAAIERHGSASLPDAETEIKVGDVVTLVAEGATFSKIAKRFDAGTDRRKKIMVLGESSQAVWLCRALKGPNYRVRVFVQDADRAVELSEKLDWVTVIRADAINTDALEEERVDLADVFVAATDDDATNLLAAARVRAMGCERAIAVQQRDTYKHLSKHIGVDRVFSPREAAVSEIQWFLSRGNFRRLASIADGLAEVYEANVTSRATELINKPLSTVTLPPGTMIGAVSRPNKDVFVPHGESALEPGDTAVVVGSKSHVKVIKRLFVGS